MKAIRVRAKNRAHDATVYFEDGYFTFTVKVEATGEWAPVEYDEVDGLFHQPAGGAENELGDPGRLMEASKYWIDWNRHSNPEISKRLWVLYRDFFSSETANALALAAV